MRHEAKRKRSREIWGDRVELREVSILLSRVEEGI